MTRLNVRLDSECRRRLEKLAKEIDEPIMLAQQNKDFTKYLDFS